MRRLLVTGVPGWLANALLHSLAASPPADLQEVRSLVRPGTITLELPETGVGFSTVTADLGDEQTLAAAVDGCDTVLHAAGLLHVRRTKDWYDVNTEGTRRLLAAATRAGVKRFVLISTNAAGGRANGFDELMKESDAARPLSHYGRSKLLAEQLVFQAAMESVVIRPCMFYGPPVPARHIEIYRRIVHGRMPLVGHGNYARSLTHIDNLVQGCLLALTHPKAPGQLYYIADDRVYTTRMIVDAMASALGVKPRYLRLPAFGAGIAYRCDLALAALGLYCQPLHLVGEADWHVGVSVEKAKTELGYAPTVTLEEGMRGAIQWCRDQKLL